MITNQPNTSKVSAAAHKAVVSLSIGSVSLGCVTQKPSHHRDHIASQALSESAMPSYDSLNLEASIRCIRLREEITPILDRLMHSYPNRVPGVFVYIDGPGLGEPIGIATGMADSVAKIPLRATDQFRCASISKMFVAATLLRLQENGLVELDDHISEYIPSDLIKGLAVYNGKDYSGEITLLQCLTHTSGLWDYFTDGQPSSDLSPFEVELFKHPNKFWSARDTLEWGKSRLDCVGAPGAVFHYSDSGYQLAGLVIERLTGGSLASAVRELVLEPLGMDSTYAEFREAPRRSANVQLSHWYFADHDLTEQISESSDYAGGGWLTTGPDLVKFMRGANSGELFSKPSSWALMRNWTDASKGGYGLGLSRIAIPEVGDLVGHLGFYGSFVALWPERDIVVVSTMNQCKPRDTNGGDLGVFAPFRNEVCQTVAKVLSARATDDFSRDQFR